MPRTLPATLQTSSIGCLGLHPVPGRSPLMPGLPSVRERLRLMRSWVCSGVRPSQLEPSLSPPVRDPGPGLLPEPAIGFAWAVGAHRADLAPDPDLLLCLLSLPPPPVFPFVGLTSVPGPSPYRLTLE